MRKNFLTLLLATIIQSASSLSWYFAIPWTIPILISLFKDDLAFFYVQSLLTVSTISIILYAVYMLLKLYSLSRQSRDVSILTETGSLSAIRRYLADKIDFA